MPEPRTRVTSPPRSSTYKLLCVVVCALLQHTKMSGPIWRDLYTGKSGPDNIWERSLRVLRETATSSNVAHSDPTEALHSQRCTSTEELPQEDPNSMDIAMVESNWPRQTPFKTEAQDINQQSSKEPTKIDVSSSIRPSASPAGPSGAYKTPNKNKRTPTPAQTSEKNRINRQADFWTLADARLAALGFHRATPAGLEKSGGDCGPDAGRYAIAHLLSVEITVHEFRALMGKQIREATDIGILKDWAETTPLEGIPLHMRDTSHKERLATLWELSEEDHEVPYWPSTTQLLTTIASKVLDMHSDIDVLEAISIWNDVHEEEVTAQTEVVLATFKNLQSAMPNALKAY